MKILKYCISVLIFNREYMYVCCEDVGCICDVFFLCVYLFS